MFHGYRKEIGSTSQPLHEPYGQFLCSLGGVQPCFPPSLHPEVGQLTESATTLSHVPTRVAIPSVAMLRLFSARFQVCLVLVMGSCQIGAVDSSLRHNLECEVRSSPKLL